MTLGNINQIRQATLPIAVMDAHSREFELFNPIVDTGFNGDLQLPIDDITRLNLSTIYTVETVLADGQIIEEKLYDAVVLWQGRPKSITVIPAEGNIPLIGVNLFWENSLTIEWQFGGRVTVSPLPE